VHYAALHRFDPARADHKDFFPFHECIAGPLHAKSFPPKATDRTFGPEVLFRVEEPEPSGSGPWADRQSFGLVKVARGSHALTVTFVSGTGKVLHEHTIAPSPGG
jgi:alkaline phosphatase D